MNASSVPPDETASASEARESDSGFCDGYAVVNDTVRLHYAIGGQGPPLLLIPGWPQTAHTWYKLMPELARHFTVIAVDPRGLGDSSRPVSGYDTNNVARDLHELMQSLGHRRYSVVGHDLGMWIAYPLAAMYPGEVDRVVMSEAGIPGLDPQRSWHFAFNQLVDLPEILVDGKEKPYIEWIITSFAFRPTDVDIDEYVRAYSKPGAMRAGFAYYRAIPQSAEQNKQHALKPLRMPVLTVGGEHSRGVGLKEMLMPVATDVEAAVVAGSGHYPQEEAPAEMLRAILPFLTRGQP